MCAKAKCLPDKTEVRESCCHYWVIDFPGESTSKGLCKLCGCEREFVNSFEKLRSAGSRQRDLSRDVLP